MTKTFDINLYDGHLIINNNGQKVLVDTGSPVTISRSDHFVFMDQEYNCSTSLMGHDISSISKMMDYDIDVLMGMDVIENYEMLTDYKSEKVTFSSDKISFEQISTTPIARVMGVVCVILRVKLYKEREKWREKKSRLYSNYRKAFRAIDKAISESQPLESLHEDFIKVGMKHFKFEEPETPDDIFMARLETEWNDYVKRAKYEFDREKRNEAARKRYEKVTKPKMQVKKKEVIEQKKALLHEYKEKYGVVCKFINVRSPYDPHHRFVVPAIEGQVVSFFVPDKFERDFYDRAMELVSFLNELTNTYGKSKVQKKGSLPEEANKSLSKLLSKLDIGRQWQGIYNESQRHYLDGTYKEEVVI